jgi:hypothetical protein
LGLISGDSIPLKFNLAIFKIIRDKLRSEEVEVKKEDDEEDGSSNSFIDDDDDDDGTKGVDIAEEEEEIEEEEVRLRRQPRSKNTKNYHLRIIGHRFTEQCW